MKTGEWESHSANVVCLSFYHVGSRRQNQLIKFDPTELPCQPYVRIWAGGF